MSVFKTSTDSHVPIIRMKFAQLNQHYPVMLVLHPVDRL